MTPGAATTAPTENDMQETLTLVPAARRTPWHLRLAALALRRASRWLDAAAARLATPPPPRPLDAALVEFHAEAGALEGALYVDGRLVARLEGVTRL
jgi:hypothetical protein